MTKLLGLLGMNTGLSFFERAIVRRRLLKLKNGDTEYARYLALKITEKERVSCQVEQVEHPASKAIYIKISFPNGSQVGLRYFPPRYGACIAVLADRQHPLPLGLTCPRVDDDARGIRLLRQLMVALATKAKNNQPIPAPEPNK